MTTREELARQLNELKCILTQEEWSAFCLAYYEDLSITEICVVLDLDTYQVNRLIDCSLYKAINLLGDNFKYLSGKR